MLALFAAQAWAAPFAYISNARDGYGGAVTVIDTATNAVVGAPIRVGVAPTGVAVNPAGTRVYVTNSMSNTVSVIDTTTGTVVGAPIAVGAEPNEVAVNPAGTRVYVVNTESHTVSVIDALTNAVIGAPIPVGLVPFGIVVNPAGTRVYVANSYSNTLSVIDTTNNVVIGAPIVVGAGPGSIAINAAGTRLYVANAYDDTVSVVDTTSNTVIGAPIAVGTYPEGIAINPAGTRVYVANGHSDTVSVIDAASNTVVGAPIEMGKGVNPFGIAVHPAGTRVYVVNYQGFTLSTIDTATNALVGTPIPAGPYPVRIGLAPAAFNNYEGLWWNSPAGSESGWGINFAHQGDTIFASWFTYDLTGKGWWLVMTANNSGGNTFTGTLLEVTGPPFDTVPFPPQGSPGGIAGSVVGTGTLTFTDANNGTFAYMVNGTSQAKAITRQAFGPLPTCTFSASNNLAAATNYQDLWWAAPAASESGWGINFSHQGDKIFASWFTFAHDRRPMWLVVTADKTAPGVYTGTLFRATGGPPFNSVPFPPIGTPGGATFASAGTATITFSDGNNASFAYTVDGVSQTKAITRQVFRPAGTVCH